MQTFMVTFADAAGAQNAVLLNGTPLGPKQIQVALVPGAAAPGEPAAAPPPSATGAASLVPQQSGVPAAGPDVAGIGAAAEAAIFGTGAKPVGAVNPFNASLNAASAAGDAAAAASVPVPLNQGQTVQSLGNIGGKNINVVISDTITIPKEMSNDPKSDEIANSICIENLGPEATADAVQEFFNKCGGVKRVLMSSEEPAEVRHAFVEFDDRTGAQAALVLSGQMLGARLIKVANPFRLFRGAPICVTRHPSAAGGSCQEYSCQAAEKHCGSEKNGECHGQGARRPGQACCNRQWDAATGGRRRQGARRSCEDSQPEQRQGGKEGQAEEQEP